MRNLLFCLILMAAFQASADAPQKITVMGMDLMVTDVQTFSGSTVIHSFRVVGPTTFTFLDGNQMVANDVVYLDLQGHISILMSTTQQKLGWKLPDGRVIQLDCSSTTTPVTGARMARVVAFHPNQEYRGGCASEQPFAFKTAIQDSITAQGEVEVDSNFNLIYAQSVQEGRITVAGQALHLQSGYEVSIFPSGQPNFFTLAPGESFSVKQGAYGVLSFGQRSDHPAATSLYANGSVQRGILTAASKHIESGFPIPAGSGVIFAEDGAATDILYASGTAIQLKNYQIVVSAFHWDRENKYYDFITGQDFQFTNPDTQAVFTVPAGYIVGADLDLNIVGVAAPRPQ